MNIDYLRYFVKLAEIRPLYQSRRTAVHYTAQPQPCDPPIRNRTGLYRFSKKRPEHRFNPVWRRILACARQTLATLDQGVSSLRLSAQGNGIIRLGFLRALGTEYIPKQAAAFLAAYPDKQIRFEFHTDRTQALLEGLLHRSYDLIFCSKPAPSMHLTAIPVTWQDLVLIVPKNHPLSGAHSVDLRETLPYPQIAFTKSPGLRKLWTNCL